MPRPPKDTTSGSMRVHRTTRRITIVLGHDVSHLDPDSPSPEIPEANASRTARQGVVEWAQRDGLTIRQLAQRIGGYSGLEMVGTAAIIADQMEQWLVEEGSDGFNVMFSHLAAGPDDFVDKVIPELQKRGLFRREYEGAALRENLGLPRPESRLFSKR